jgi:hypothetical protein
MDPLTGQDDLVLFLGQDQHGVPLEVMGREWGDGQVTLFHAMRMRPRYDEAYEEVMRWRSPRTRAT